MRASMGLELAKVGQREAETGSQKALGTAVPRQRAWMKRNVEGKCSGLLSVAVINTMAKSNLGGGKHLFGLYFQVAMHHWQKSWHEH